jgi:hypothetical protein
MFCEWLDQNRLKAFLTILEEKIQGRHPFISPIAEGIGFRVLGERILSQDTKLPTLTIGDDAIDGLLGISIQLLHGEHLALKMGENSSDRNLAS